MLFFIYLYILRYTPSSLFHLPYDLNKKHSFFFSYRLNVAPAFRATGTLKYYALHFARSFVTFQIKGWLCFPKKCLLFTVLFLKKKGRKQIMLNLKLMLNNKKKTLKSVDFFFFFFQIKG